MKVKILSLLLPLAMMFACKSSTSNLTYLSSADNGKELIVFADYEQSKSRMIEKYLEANFKQKITLENAEGISVKLKNGEPATITSTTGHIDITYNKLKGSAKGIVEMENIKRDLKTVLFDK